MQFNFKCCLFLHLQQAFSSKPKSNGVCVEFHIKNISFYFINGILRLGTIFQPSSGSVEAELGQQTSLVHIPTMCYGPTRTERRPALYHISCYNWASFPSHCIWVEIPDGFLSCLWRKDSFLSLFSKKSSQWGPLSYVKYNKTSQWYQIAMERFKFWFFLLNVL